MWQVTGADRGAISESMDKRNMSLEEAVMSENENMALYIRATPLEGDEECQSSVAISAPNFRVVPDSHFTEATSGRPGDYVFILAPEKAGRKMVSVSSEIGYLAFDVQVENWMGISPFWDRVMVGVGTVLGPMLTIPWWLERRRGDEQQPKQEGGASEPN